MAADSSDDSFENNLKSDESRGPVGADANDSLFTTSDDAIVASMDDAFDDIVREPAPNPSELVKPSWWYVENGRRIGPVRQEELVAAVHAQADPRNVLIWNEGFPTWKRFGDSLLSEEQPTLAAPELASDEPRDGQTDPFASQHGNPAEDEMSVQADSSESNILSDGPDILEDVLEPEGDPINDWVPHAAAALREIDTAEAPTSNTDVVNWEDDEEDYGLPPTLSTAEFQRVDVSSQDTKQGRATWFKLSLLSIMLFAGAAVVTYELLGPSLFEVQTLENEPIAPKNETPTPIPTEGVDKPDDEIRLETSIQASQPPTSDVQRTKTPEPAKKNKAKRSRRKVKKLPQTINDALLASALKKKSSTLAPCIEGAVKAGELPAGRHVMVLAYDILPNGRVSGASLVGPAYLLGASLSRCVESTMSGWRYQKTAKGRIVRDQELAFRARAP